MAARQMATITITSATITSAEQCTTSGPSSPVAGWKWRHKDPLANIQNAAKATVLKSSSLIQLLKYSSSFAVECWRQPTIGISETFAKLKKEGKVAFIPHVTAFDPDLSTTAQALKVLDSCGSDIIDLGIPYSDPLADGPVIQDVPQLSVPIVLSSSNNPILKLGVETIMSIIDPRPPRVYDTFISYKRGDTLHPVSHLKSALDRKGIRTFFDLAMDGGVEFWPAVKKAIEQSESAVIVVSPKYHFSPWCLDEAVKILQCHKRWGLKVLPIFWDVDAKELREQSRLFVENIGQDEKGFQQENPQQVLVWRNALRTLGMFNGWPVKSSLYRTEAEVIEDLATRISKSLNRMEEPTHA